MKRIRLLMLTASLSLTGTHRILMDLVERLDKKSFEVLLAYKPEYPGPGNDLIPEIEALGLKLFPLRGRHLFDLRGLMDIYTIVSRHEVDIIQCWDSLSLAARVLGKAGGAKIIDSLGNPPVHMNWKEYITKSTSSLLLDGVVFQSRGSQELHHQNGANVLRWCKEKVIYNCLELQKLPHHDVKARDQIRKKYGFAEDDLILTNLGMYNDQKAQEYLIWAMPEVLRFYDNMKLLLIGWGEREGFLRSQIQSFGLSDKVILTGKKQKSEVFELLAIAEIYLSSSLWEGLPIAVLEAMAFRLPVVGTDVVGNREVISNNETGILVPVQNPSALANAISELIADPPRRRTMGKAGRLRVEQQFIPEIFVRKHESFYREVLGN
jgi:glycosyltransferase involved in cell wall biosynthesis